MALIWRETEHTNFLLKAWETDKSMQDIMKGRHCMVHKDIV